MHHRNRRTVRRVNSVSGRLAEDKVKQGEANVKFVRRRVHDVLIERQNEGPFSNTPLTSWRVFEQKGNALTVVCPSKGFGEL